MLYFRKRQKAQAMQNNYRNYTNFRTVSEKPVFCLAVRELSNLNKKYCDCYTPSIPT
jgi:hypothetical protein